MVAKQKLRTCITLFCTFLCRHCTTTTWQWLISGFVKDGNLRQQLSFSFPALWYSPLEFNSKQFANIWWIKRDGISAIKFEAARIHFLSDVFVAGRRRCCLSSLLSRHSCSVRSPSFPNQKRRNYRWVEKRFGYYQQEQFNLHWENSVSDGSQCIVNNRKFKMKRRRESKKSDSLTEQNNNFARASRFLAFFFAVTARLPRENT